MSINPLHDISNERLASLLRQWVRSDIIRQEYIRHLDDEAWKEEINTQKWIISSPEATFLFVWLALLFSVLEAMKEAKVDIFETFDIDEEYYKKFKRFRDSVFHIGSEFWDLRVKTFLEIEDSPEKSKELHLRIGPLLKEETEQRVQEGRLKLIVYSKAKVRKD